LWFDNGAYQSATLYRDPVPGHPELNTVNTPIILNAAQTVSAACTTSGAISNDATGALVSCNGGTWKAVGGSAYWGDPVANVASLPACSAANTGATRVVNTPTVGSGPRAYSCNGVAWNALSVDDSGNLVVGNTAVGAVSSTTATGKLAVGVIEIKTRVTLATACSPDGSIATTSAGVVVSCQSGLWTGSSAAGLGVGQTWHNVLASRTNGATYTNNTGAPIMACANSAMAPWGVPYSFMYVDGLLIFQNQVGQSGQGSSGIQGSCGIVPAGSTYSITCSPGCATRVELY
jgi:hypothetical protein